MSKTLVVRVRTEPLPLSPANISVLRSLERYDLIAFTSKNARRIFSDWLRKQGIILPKTVHILQVGPRSDLLKFKVEGKRILFPRSSVAPYDIVHKLRKRGAVVRVVPLYTAHAIPLTRAERTVLRQGTYSVISFSSPSGVSGFLAQLNREERVIALRLPARCIGPTTARAARAAGFKNVRV